MGRHAACLHFSQRLPAPCNLRHPPVSEVEGGAGDGLVTYSLAAFPAKDNYEGRLYPLDWIDKVGVGGALQQSSLKPRAAAGHDHRGNPRKVGHCHACPQTEPGPYVSRNLGTGPRALHAAPQVAGGSRRCSARAHAPPEPQRGQAGLCADQLLQGGQGTTMRAVGGFSQLVRVGLDCEVWQHAAPSACLPNAPPYMQPLTLASSRPARQTHQMVGLPTGDGSLRMSVQLC